MFTYTGMLPFVIDDSLADRLREVGDVGTVFAVDAENLWDLYEKVAELVQVLDSEGMNHEIDKANIKET